MLLFFLALALAPAPQGTLELHEARSGGGKDVKPPVPACDVDFTACTPGTDLAEAKDTHARLLRDLHRRTIALVEANPCTGVADVLISMSK